MIKVRHREAGAPRPDRQLRAPEVLALDGEQPADHVQRAPGRWTGQELGGEALAQHAIGMGGSLADLLVGIVPHAARVCERSVAARPLRPR
jgi:hypothetical protein